MDHHRVLLFGIDRPPEVLLRPPYQDPSIGLILRHLQHRNEVLVRLDNHPTGSSEVTTTPGWRTRVVVVIVVYDPRGQCSCAYLHHAVARCSAERDCVERELKDFLRKVQGSQIVVYV
ncbi:hypothetical protein Taro_023866 [Colocasia esculenta]|uniref:Uncharacterized protein n=1 Tax=Colocasia esculenta TaxID=4460 RepID=A0A843VC27_COLES|nr:hypothetical protein [Colocasia esculenta]